MPTKEDIFGQVTALTRQFQEDNEKILNQMEDNKVRADTLIAVLAKYFNIAGQTGIQAPGSDCSQETKKSKEVLREGFKVAK